jgi:multidrug resistance efflux pump
VVALIGAFAAILAAYWQFVYKRTKEASGSTGNATLQSPIVNVSPNINVSIGTVDHSTMGHSKRKITGKQTSPKSQ